MWHVVDDGLEPPEHRILRETCSTLRRLAVDAEIRLYDELWSRRFHADSPTTSEFDRDCGVYIPEGLKGAWEETP